MAVGRIIGIVVGAISAAVIVGVVVYCVFIKLRKGSQHKSTTTYSHSQPTGTSTSQYSTSQSYNTKYSTGETDFKYGQKQEMSSYPQTANGPNTYDTSNSSAVNGAAPYPSGPIGFEGEKPQNDVSGPPPYPTTPQTGFQDTPTVPPPAYTRTAV